MVSDNGVNNISGEIGLVTTDDLTVDGKRVADDCLVHLQGSFLPQTGSSENVWGDSLGDIISGFVNRTQNNCVFIRKSLKMVFNRLLTINI